jgi:hypothetical protein
MDKIGKRSILEVVQTFIREVCEQGVSVHAAYLFGSQVSGNMHSLSDIDVLLISDSFHSSNRKSLRPLSSVLIEKQFRGISPTIFPLSTFLKGGLFLREILPKAIQIPVPGQPFPIELPAVYRGQEQIGVL